MLGTGLLTLMPCPVPYCLGSASLTITKSQVQIPSLCTSVYMCRANAPSTAQNALSMSSCDEYDLLKDMRQATRRAHHVANALILTKLVVVLTDKRLYAEALSSFLPVYAKLTQLMKQHAKVPGLSTVIAAVDSIPSRSEAMEQDLQQLLGSNWRSRVPCSPAADAYASHLQELSDKDPVLLLPYVFSMHIPILLGFLGDRIQRTLQLPDKQGLSFFTVEDKAEKLACLRRAVTAAGRSIDASKRQLLVSEAVEQFRRNNAVVAEFSVGWRPVLQALQRALLAVPLYVYVGALGLLVAAVLAWTTWSQL